MLLLIWNFGSPCSVLTDFGRRLCFESATSVAALVVNGVLVVVVVVVPKFWMAGSGS